MQLTTERLILREFEEPDWPAVLAYQPAPLYLRYYEWTDRTPEAVQSFVHRFLAQQQEQPRTKFQLAIRLKASRQLIGNCGLRMESAEAQEADIADGASPRQWGRGYATEAARGIGQVWVTHLQLP